MPVQTGVAKDPGSVNCADVAVDGAGNATAVWAQGWPVIHIWANRFSKGSGWGVPVALDTTMLMSSPPEVAIDGWGNAIAVWEHDSDGEDGDARTVIQAGYYSISTGWKPTLTIANGNGDALQPQAAMDAAGNVIVVWSLWNGTFSNRTGSTVWSNRYVPGVGWGAAQRIDTSNMNSASSPKIAVDPAGDAITVWSQYDGSMSSIWASQYANTLWGVPEQVGLGFWPQVAADAAGNAVAVWQQSNLTEGSSSILTSHFTQGVGWSAARVIEGFAGWSQDVIEVFMPKVAMNPAGDAFAIWDRMSNGGGFQVMAIRSVGGLNWDVPVAVGRLVESRSPAPDVAIDSLGNAIVVWDRCTASDLPVAPPLIWTSRYTVGVGWDSEQAIDLGAGFAWGPQAAIDSAGNAVVIWQQSYGPRHNLWSNTYAVGEGWGSATLVERAAGGISDPQITAYGNGNAIAVWSQGDGTRESVWSNVYVEGMGWRGATPIDASLNDEFAPQVGVDSRGNAMAVWQQWDGVRYGVWSSQYDIVIGWSSPAEVDAGSENAFLPQIAVDRFGNAIAVWQQRNETDYSIWANRYNASLGWDNATLIGARASAPRIGMDCNGSVVVVWSGGSVWSNGRFWSNRYMVGVGWGSAVAIGWNGTSDPQVAVDAKGNAIVVWSEDWGDDAGIWANRFEPDAGWKGVKQVEAGVGIGGLQIAVNAQGNAIIVWQPHIPYGGYGHVWATRDLVGRAWGDWEVPAQIDKNDSMPDSPRLAIASSGNAVTVWQEWHEYGVQVWANSYLVGLGWGYATSISGNPGHISNASGAHVAMDTAGSAVVVWTETDRTSSSIWSNCFVLSYIPPDSTVQPDIPIIIVPDLTVLTWVAIADSVGVIVLATFVLFMYRMHWKSGPDGPVEIRTDMQSENPDSASNQVTHAGHLANNSGVLVNGLAPERRWPARAASGPVRLTAKERILLHLMHFARYADSSEVPPELTQERIVEAVGIDRRHFTQYVNPLEEDGLVRERTTHVRGAVQRRRVYVLTAEGEHRALGVRDRVLSATVRVRDTSGAREVTVAEALLEARGSMSVLDILRESMEMGVVDLTR